MAYIVGLLKPSEKAELERRGWEIEPPPKDLVAQIPPENDTQYGMVFVDSNMFNIMSGADWDKGPPKKITVTVSDIQVTERKVEIPSHCPKCRADLTDRGQKNLRVWEYCDQERRGYLPANQEEAHDNYGINTGGSANGGESFIDNVSVWCVCGEILVGGKFERLLANKVPVVTYTWSTRTPTALIPSQYSMTTSRIEARRYTV